MNDVDSLINLELKVNDPVLDYISSPKYSNFGYHLNKLIEEKFVNVLVGFKFNDVWFLKRKYD